MPSWNWKLPHERRELRFQNIACHLRTVYWIGTIANDNAFAGSLGGPHAICHRVDKCINAAADVLHIKNQDIDVSQHLVCRFPGLAVQRINRHAGFAIHGVICLDHIVLDIATNSVLRTKQSLQINIGMFVEEIGCMLIAMTDRGLIANQPDTRSFYQIGLSFKQFLKSKSDVMSVSQPIQDWILSL